MSAPDDKQVECPFYKSDHRRKRNIIRCEGIMRDTISHVIFLSDENMLEHKNRFCRKQPMWKECPLAKALQEKYEDNT